MSTVQIDTWNKLRFYESMEIVKIYRVYFIIPHSNHPIRFVAVIFIGQTVTRSVPRWNWYHIHHGMHARLLPLLVAVGVSIPNVHE